MSSSRQEMARRGAVTIGMYLLAVPASMLPPRWRRALRLREDLPVADMNMVSAFAQFIGCIGAGAIGLLAWSDAQYGEGARGPDGDAAIGYTLLRMNPVLPLVYIFTTPVGFLTALFTLSGLVRAIHQGATREPGHDPVLGGIDWLLATLTARRRVRQREASKAPGPDRITAGTPGQDFALRIDSIADYDFKPGNTVQVGPAFYRVLRVREMKTSGGLRILYDLEAMPVGVAVRGLRRYDPPPGVLRP